MCHTIAFFLRKADDEGNSHNDADTSKSQIDISILYTCWKSYSEALPVLYGSNVFYFSNVHQLNVFRYKNLPLLRAIDYPDYVLPVFYTKITYQGRLSMTRKLGWLLTWSHGPSSLNLPDSEPRPSNRESTVKEWSTFLLRTPYADGSKCIEFPALEDLELGFTDLALQPEEEKRLDVSLSSCVNTSHSWPASLSPVFSISTRPCNSTDRP